MGRRVEGGRGVRDGEECGVCTLCPGLQFISTQDRATGNQVTGGLSDVIVILVQSVHRMKLEENKHLVGNCST